MAAHATSTPIDDAVVSAFASWGSALAWERLPSSTRAAALSELLDFIGDGVAGRAAVGMPEWLAVLCDDAGARPATLFGGSRASAWTAAMANGYFGHVMELDDTHDLAVLHAGASAIPAAIAASEYAGGIDGKTLLAGIVAGIELNCRLGVATDLSLVEGGWIYSALLGHFGAALAAARVLGCDAATTRAALGIAYSFTCGNHQSSREGAPTKHLQPGIAAGNGVKAALMAARGLQAVQAPFLGEDGFVRTYLHGRFDTARALDALGTRFEVDRLSMKPYPSCRLTHPAVSAALELRRRLGADIERVQAVQVSMGRQAFDVVGRSVDFRLDPKRWLDAQFSVFWTVAVALRHGVVTPRHLMTEVPPSADLRSWIGRIRAQPLAGSALRDVGACTLEAQGPFGSVRVEAPQAKGHPDNPLSAEELFEKFRGNVELAGIEPASARTLADGILALERSADLSPLLRALVCSPKEIR